MTKYSSSSGGGCFYWLQSVQGSGSKGWQSSAVQESGNEGVKAKVALHWFWLLLIGYMVISEEILTPTVESNNIIINNIDLPLNV